MTQVSIDGIEAEVVTLGSRVQIGKGTRIVARSVNLADGVIIGDEVTISCDELTAGPDARIAAHSTIISPTIAIGERSRIGASLRAELNEHFVVGRLCDIGHSVRLIGQGVKAGDHLWLTDRVV